MDGLQAQLLQRVGHRALYLEVPFVHEVRVLTATVSSGWAALTLDVLPRRGLAPRPPRPWSAGSPLARVRFAPGWMSAHGWGLCTDPQLLASTLQYAVVTSHRPWSPDRCRDLLGFIRSRARDRRDPRDLD
jgi:hypothetical protein